MQKLNLNFFQKSLSTRIESCLVPHKGQFSLDNQKILKLTKFDLKEVTEIILSFLEDPGNLQKHSSYLTIWKLLVENTLSKDLILVIKPEIVPGLVRGGSGKIFLLFLVDVTALYGSEHVNLALTTTTLIDALPVEEQAPAQVYGTPPIVQVGNIGIPKEPSPEDITMHFNKVNLVILITRLSKLLNP